MAKTICKILGIIFILVGLVGFLPSARGLLGAHLSAVHNLIHLVSGAIALYLGFKGTLHAAKLFCLVFGIVYLLLGVVGFLLGDAMHDRMIIIVSGRLELGTMDHIIHIALGAIFLIGALLTKGDTATAET
jgi:hypothetical protein